MANYIVLINWTDQGIKAVKDSAKRLDAGRELAKKLGCTVGDAYLGGNVRTTTLKAFPEDAYRRIVGSLLFPGVPLTGKPDVVRVQQAGGLK